MVIDGVPLVDIGQSGLLGLTVLFILTDRLVWHKRLNEKDKLIVALEEKNAELVRQNGVLLDSAVPALKQALGE